MSERSGIHITGKDSGWPVGGDAEPEPKKDGSGVDDLPKVQSVAGGVVNAAEEEQRVEDTGGDAGTSFTLTFKGQTTAALNKDTATHAQVQTALEALSNIAPGDIEVTGDAGGPWTIRFLEDGTYGDEDVPAITGTAVNVNEVQTVTIEGSPAGGTFKLGFEGEETGTIAFNPEASAVQTALRALAKIGSTGVTVTGSKSGPFTVTFAGGLAGKNVAQLTANNAGLTGGTSPKAVVTTGTPGKTGPTIVVETVVGG